VSSVPFSRPSSLVVVLAASVLVAYAGWAKPYFNWDLLPYTAVALRFGGVPEDVLHVRTYTAARERLPEPVYHMLAEVEGYRRTVAADADAFRHQLPYYAAKPAFPALLAVANALGVHPIRSATLLPRVIYLFLGAAVVWWAAAAFGGATGPLVGLALAGLPFVIEVACLATPDGLSACFIVTALVLLLHRREPRWALAAATLAVLVRPDNVIWTGVVAGAAFLEDRRHRVPAVAALAVAVGGSLALLQWAGVPGWSGWFYGAFVDPGRAPTGEVAPSLTAVQYLATLVRRANPRGLPSFLVLFAAAAAAIILVRRRLRLPWDVYTRVLVLAWLGAVALWLAFPRFENRFLVPWYLLTLMCLLVTWRTVSGRGLNRAVGPG